ncbi:hypothetical protein IMZ48_18145, partial [Candidatus Bathyarchaeota archaeon]|nr:hypothetical protein [Candidatus Bathyarchaeota archaeon]
MPALLRLARPLARPAAHLFRPATPLLARSYSKLPPSSPAPPRLPEKEQAE